MNRAVGAHSLLQVPRAIWERTFSTLRQCGHGRRECQVLWLSPWATPQRIDRLMHPKHRVRGDGFDVDSEWLTELWLHLAATGCGVRVQVHTHPMEAFHSRRDDDWPMVHTAGFLSLVVPDCARGAASFRGLYLTELQADGTWSHVTDLAERLRVE